MYLHTAQGIALLVSFHMVEVHLDFLSAHSDISAT